ncbi:MAG: trypsin-like peptidase domain-containing protein [Sedimentitalea sp.]|nr:trypsin-like peptidase domain-containing protein [Sedimentitalea sp.]
MPRLLTPKALKPLLESHDALVDEALEVIYLGQPFQHTLATLREAARLLGKTPEAMVVETLISDEMDDRFVAILRGQGIDLLPPDQFGEVAFGPVRSRNFDPHKMVDFALAARNCRCRIGVETPAGSRVFGSGALVSRRLVVTATHVVDEAVAAAGGDARRIRIFASDGRPYPAWSIFASPCHDNDRNGLPAPAEAFKTHTDVALLRTYRRLGNSNEYGHLELGETPVQWQGTAKMYLVHYPQGLDQGFSEGRVERAGPQDMYFPHDVATEGGSSGGLAFDDEFAFLGLHQGRLPGNTGRLVPFHRIAAAEGFATTLKSDVPPRYLWALDETADSPLIIGRNLFFDALSAMIEGEAPALKGIWVRRIDTDDSAGLTFSFRILDAFLGAHDSRAITFRVSLELVVSDLIGSLHRQVVGTADAPAPAAGVREDETGEAASDRDRARRLADALQDRAEAAGETHWFHFENPPSGLSRNAQIQLEHVVSEILLRPDLRLVLSGYETFEMIERQFETVTEARDPGPPGLLVEFIGEFSRADLRATVAEMSRDLKLDWTADVIDHAVDLALAGVAPVAGFFPAAAARQVAERLRAHVRLQGGLP